MKTSAHDRDPPQRELGSRADTDAAKAGSVAERAGALNDTTASLLVYAPDQKAMDITAVLHARGLHAKNCASMDELDAEMQSGVAGCILTEDVVAELQDGSRMLELLRAQPWWMDCSMIVLASEPSSDSLDHALESLRGCAHVVVLDAPWRAERLAHAARMAVRARHRLDAARVQLEEMTRRCDELSRRNAELESRIATRTHELVEANNRLMKEIAGRERAQAALGQAQKLEAIGRLTGGIAHDFNNLLHVVNMNLELVKMYSKEEKVMTVVDRAKTAAKRGSRLTGQLLSFARSQSLVPRMTDLNKLLLGMRDLLEISVGSAVQVEIELGQPVHVLVDSGQLEMALLNLAANSKDAMPEGGTFRITTQIQQRKAEGELHAGEYVCLTAADTGPGIPPHVLPKVFDPFFSTKPLGQGTGLGLSQVYGFARQSGGLAHIRSEPGQGTAVELLFPIVDAQSQAPAEPAVQAPAVSPPSPSEHILVVDDDPEVRRVIVECLSVIGYRVTEAANGREGLAAVATNRPNLMVVDYVMPDMTGAEMISRARRQYGEVPVIVATGYADMAAVERLAGKPLILRKPFSMGALGDAVRQTLDAAQTSRGAAAHAS